MKSYIDEINRLLDLQADITNHTCRVEFDCRNTNENEYYTYDSYHGVSYAWNRGSFIVGGTPDFSSSLQSNLARLGDVLRGSQDQLATATTQVSSSNNSANTLKSQISSTQASINRTSSEASMLQAKIAESTKLQQLKQQEYNTTQQKKEALINNMNPKQVSFVMQKSIEQHDEAMINLLINKPFDVDFQSSNQDTLLHIVIKYGHQPLLQKVLANHPNPNLPDKDGNTPSHLAIQKQDLPLLKSLMTSGAMADAVNKEDSTLLHTASAVGSLAIVKYLREECPQKGVIDVNAKDIHGHSCLEVAKGEAVKAYLQPQIIVMYAEIEYDNPVLNHPELLDQAAKKYGHGIIEKLINLSMVFTETQESKDLLHSACSEPNGLENVISLIGLDISHSTSV